ncbi:MAG: type II toxin-antitoxin system RelE/ParE family toxin [Phycisphaerales bacterium]|nr:type II toxin-antitoxin system RelE/ParE family toxin [Phycisphaerales bacterium]
MSVIWSPQALEKAEQILEYLDERSPEAAERFSDGLFNAVERLVDFPRMGRMVPELKNPNVRQILQGNYRVIYRLEGDDIRIVTLRHQRQNLTPDDDDLQ